MIIDIASCQDSTLKIFISILRKGLNILWIVGPVLAIISITIIFSRMSMNPEDKKLLKNLNNSIIALVVLFFIPLIVTFTMNLLGDSFDFSACWNDSENSQTGTSGTYIPIDEEKDGSNPFSTSDYDEGEKD